MEDIELDILQNLNKGKECALKEINEFQKFIENSVANGSIR